MFAFNRIALKQKNGVARICFAWQERGDGLPVRERVSDGQCSGQTGRTPPLDRAAGIDGNLRGQPA